MKFRRMRVAFYTIVFLVFFSCSSDGTKESVTAENGAVLSASETTSETKRTLQEKYVAAISEYLKKYPVKGSDTVFIGRHPEFPAIELPSVIHETNVRVLNGETAVTYFASRSNIVYLNVMAWIDNSSAEFLIVTFVDSKPQHNMHLFFRQTGNDFALDSMGMDYPYSKNRPAAYSGR